MRAGMHGNGAAAQQRVGPLQSCGSTSGDTAALVATPPRRHAETSLAIYAELVVSRGWLLSRAPPWASRHLRVWACQPAVEFGTTRPWSTVTV